MLVIVCSVIGVGVALLIGEAVSWRIFTLFQKSKNYKKWWIIIVLWHKRKYLWKILCNNIKLYIKKM